MPDGCELPDFNECGLLPPGLHAACFDAFRTKFGFNSKRLEMINNGLQAVCSALDSRGIHRLYVGGDFVTEKPFPEVIDTYVLVPNSRNPMIWFIEQKSLVWLPIHKVNCLHFHHGATGWGSEQHWQKWFGHDL